MKISFLFITLFIAAFSFNTIQAQEVREIVIESNDRMQFDIKEIKVKVGETIKLTLKHVGKMPVQAMGHNWVLLESGIKVNEFAMEAAKARDNDYIPKDTKDVIVTTKLLGGGEEDTITFEAPEKGTYMFLCSFTGHFGLMQGTFVVE